MRPPRISAAIAATALLTGATFIPAAPALAYTTNGCVWSGSSLRINSSGVSGSYLSGLTSAISNYNIRTDVTLTRTTASGPVFTARTSNYGATGWEGRAQVNCLSGKASTRSASSQINTHYVKSSAPLNRIKVLWLHELGHSLGLGHVSSKYRIMYPQAVVPYNNGVTALTTDEINGINALY